MSVKNSVSSQFALFTWKMGCCTSVSPEQQIEKQLNKSVGDELAVDKKQDHFVKKLLFLGSGGSGKSTNHK